MELSASWDTQILAGRPRTSVSHEEFDFGPSWDTVAGPSKTNQNVSSRVRGNFLNLRAMYVQIRVNFGAFLARCVCQFRVIHQVLQRYMSQSGEIFKIIWQGAGTGAERGLRGRADAPAAHDVSPNVY